MKIVLYDSAQHLLIWNEFNSNAKNGSFLFMREFMDYHNDRFKDNSLMVWENNSLLALLPANIKGNILYSHQGLTYGGLVVKKDIKLTAYLKCFYSILKECHTQNIQFIDIKPIPKFLTNYATDEEEYAAFLGEAELVRRDTAMVITYQNQLKISGNIRREAAKAEKEGATLVFDDKFENFWNDILIPNLKQKHGVNPVHNILEITALKHSFPNNIIQVNAYKEQQLVAGTTLFLNGSAVHCQYISSSDVGRKAGVLNFLFQNVIESFKESRKFFDFGIVNEDEGKTINTGMLFWKEGLGGRTHSHNFYRFSTSNYILLQKFAPETSI